MKIKTFFMVFLSVFAVILTTSCSDYLTIRSVKTGKLDIDKSRTVEEAVTAVMDDVKWTTFTSEDNYKVVEVNGVWKLDMYEKAIGETKLLLSIIPEDLDLLTGGKIAIVKCLMDLCPVKGDGVKLQFIIEDDERFQFSYGAIMTKGRPKTCNIRDVVEVEASTSAEGIWREDSKSFLDLIYFPRKKCDELKKTNAELKRLRSAMR